MNTPEGQPSPNLDSGAEPYLDDLVAEFDAKNSALLMSYVRQIEHPGQKSMQNLNDALEDTEKALLHITRKIFHGDMGDIDERSNVIVQIFDGIINDRRVLFGEYSQLSSPSPEKQNIVRDEFIADIQRSLLDSPEAFRDEILNQFYGFIATDAGIIDSIIEHGLSDTPRYNIGPLTLPNPKEMAKIGAGIAIGMIVASKFIRK